MSDTKNNSSLTRALRGLTWARLQRAMRLGIRSLWLHRLRSLLTVLGIVFGVCSVIAMLAISQGASYESQIALRRLGSDNIIIESVKPPNSESKASGQTGGALSYGLKRVDVARLRESTMEAERWEKVWTAAGSVKSSAGT